MKRDLQQLKRNKELWNRFIGGDDNAFAQLYELNVESMLYYGLHFSLLRDLVKDAIQDVFVYIYSNRHKLKKIENVRLYLYVSLKNRIFAVFNKDMEYYQLDTMEPVFTVENSPEEKYIHNEQKKEVRLHIRQMLDTLTPRQREVIYYRFTEGMSYDEIGVLMKMNYQSVRNLIHRSVTKIRETYQFYSFPKNYFKSNKEI